MIRYRMISLEEEKWDLLKRMDIACAFASNGHFFCNRPGDFSRILREKILRIDYIIFYVGAYEFCFSRKNLFDSLLCPQKIYKGKRRFL